MKVQWYALLLFSSEPSSSIPSHSIDQFDETDALPILEE